MTREPTVDEERILRALAQEFRCFRCNSMNVRVEFLQTKRAYVKCESCQLVWGVEKSELKGLSR